MRFGNLTALKQSLVMHFVAGRERFFTLWACAHVKVMQSGYVMNIPLAQLRDARQTDPLPFTERVWLRQTRSNNGHKISFSLPHSLYLPSSYNAY